MVFPLVLFCFICINWCFTSYATIMRRHRCEGGLDKTLFLQLGSQRHTFRRVLQRARQSTDTGPPFLYGYSEKNPPHLNAFYNKFWIRRTHSRLNPLTLIFPFQDLHLFYVDTFLSFNCHISGLEISNIHRYF